MASSVVMQLTIPVGQKMSTVLTKLIMQSVFKVIKHTIIQKKPKPNNNWWYYIFMEKLTLLVILIFLLTYSVSDKLASE